jgi:hypothetical protein
VPYKKPIIPRVLGAKWLKLEMTERRYMYI